MLPDLIDLFELKAHLARRDWTMLDLARKLGHPVSTLSAWTRGAHPAPADLPARIERVLGLPSGSLAKKAA